MSYKMSIADPVMLIPTRFAAQMSRSDIRGIACSATWFQRGQQVRTQASARLDHRATIWGT